MTNNDLILYIRSRLGDPAIDVELDNTQIQAGIDQALRLWNRRFPTEKLMKVDVVSGVQAYDLSSVTGLRGIMVVTEQPIEYNTTIEFDIFRDRVWHLPVPNITDIAMDTVYLNTLRYVGSTEFDWRFEETTKKLYLSPIPSRSYPAMVIYTMAATVEEATVKYDWVVDYALEASKETLGFVRRKHGDKVPGRELEIPLDGAALISEAKESMKELKDKLEMMGGDWLPPIRG